jgi:hypothetical protein
MMLPIMLPVIMLTIHVSVVVPSEEIDRHALVKVIGYTAIRALTKRNGNKPCFNEWLQDLYRFCNKSSGSNLPLLATSTTSMATPIMTTIPDHDESLLHFRFRRAGLDLPAGPGATPGTPATPAPATPAPAPKQDRPAASESKGPSDAALRAVEKVSQLNYLA